MVSKCFAQFFFVVSSLFLVQKDGKKKDFSYFQKKIQPQKDMM